MLSIVPAQARIDKLSIQHTWYFTGYIIFVLLSGLFTWLLWRSGNRLQDAIRHDANARIAEATLGVEQAKESAAKAHERVTTFEAQAEELRAQNLATESRLEEERRTRLELEKTRAPRQIGFKMMGPGKTTIDPLRPFAGIQMIFAYLPEAEPLRAAENSIWLTEKASWQLLSAHPRQDLNIGFFDGVIVRHLAPPVTTPEFNQGLPTKQHIDDMERSRDAANALVSFLISHGWEAQSHWASRGEIPSNTIKVIVGLKPNPYFTENMLPENVREFFRKSQEEIKKYLEKPR